MSDDLLGLSAAQAAAAIERGELGAAELFAFYRDRARADADANGDGLNCFTWVAEGIADTPGPSAPGWSDAPSTPGAGPLAGVPLAVKDLFCTKGVPSQSGSRMLEGYRPPYTANAVGALTSAGATLLAKTNQDEFAMGSSTENSAYGPTLNPWDRARVPGGSSGGSAAAVAAGLAPWALGTDTGGSIRQPAALCGIVGVKPTYGSVSRYGMIAFASSLDQAGPLTRDVTDAALMLRHMVGRDGCDATSLQFPHELELPRAERLDGLRLGVPAELRAPDGDAAGARIEPGVRAAFERALELAQELGASVEDDPPAARPARALGLLRARARGGLLEPRALRRRALRPARGRRRRAARDVHAHAHDGFGAEVRRRIMLGTYALSAGYYDAYYGRAQRVRTKIAEDFGRRSSASTDRHADLAERRVRARREDRGPVAMYLTDYCTVPMSLAGIPAISIPAGLSEGLPVGLQIAGPAFSENRLLDAAHALERALGFQEGAARV